MKSQDFWNEYYSLNSFKDKEPNRFLQRMLPRLQKGKTLEIAMGEGINSIFLSENGFQVKGFDVSNQAIENANTYSKEKNVIIEAECKDLDLFLLGLMEYDTIVMFNFKPPLLRYYSEMVRALKQGGTLLIESLMVDEIKEVYGSENAYKDYYYSSNEILKHLKDLKILFYNENKENGYQKVQCLAQKPSDKDASKYNLFDMQSSGQNQKNSPHLDLAESLFKKK